MTGSSELSENPSINPSITFHGQKSEWFSSAKTRRKQVIVLIVVVCETEIVLKEVKLRSKGKLDCDGHVKIALPNAM